MSRTYYRYVKQDIDGESIGTDLVALDDLPAVFRGLRNPVKGFLTTQDVEHAVNNVARTPSDNLTQEDVPVTTTEENRTPADTYDIIDRIVGHGTVDDGMPKLEVGTPVCGVRWYGETRKDDF